MAGDWASTGAHHLNYSAGDFAGTGAFTTVLLCKPSANGMRLMSWFSSGTERGGMLFDNVSPFPLYGSVDDFSSGYGSSSSVWTLAAMSKPSGNAHRRSHLWVYQSDGSGTMSHGEAAGAGNKANVPVAATDCRLGFAASLGGIGQIAAAAYFDRELSDAELDSLVSTNLSDWDALNPDLGIELSAWDGTTGDVVFAGSSGAATKTGTVGSAANPTGFDFTLGSPGGGSAVLLESGIPLLLESGAPLALE